MLGSHTLKTWSTTQATVAMSSAEAELYALTKGASASLGMIAMCADLGVEVEAKVMSDASATLSIVQRQGLGKLRHVNVQYLWVQDRIRSGELAAEKVAGTANPADALTKYLVREIFRAYMAKAYNVQAALLMLGSHLAAEHILGHERRLTRAARRELRAASTVTAVSTP